MEENLTPLSPEEQASEEWMEKGAELQAEYDASAEERSELEEILAQEQAVKARQEKDQGFLPNNPLQLAQETGTAVVGGLADAVESVGGFLELSGDTYKTGMSKLLGHGYDETQDPFSEQYEHGDGAWLDIPDNLVPENHSGLGRLTRGLAEFGFLVWATGGIGGGVGAGARAGTRLAAAGRAAGLGSKGARILKVVPKGVRIATDGAVADLVSSSSETANIANLVQEHAPFIPFLDALAIDPDKDDAWTARIKTVLAGSGMNILGHFLAGYVKGAWRGAKARKAGASVDEANQIVNQTVDAEIREGSYLDEAAATERAIDQWDQGYGISNAEPRKMYRSTYLDEAENARFDDPFTSEGELNRLDEIADQRGDAAGDPWDIETGQSAKQFEAELTRKPDSAVNPNLFTDADKATYRPDSPDPVQANLKQSINNNKRGLDPSSSTPLFTEAALNKMARGSASIRQFIIEQGNKIAREAFKDIDNTLNFKEVQDLILRQTAEMHDMLADGGDGAVKQLKDYFLRGDKDSIVWTHDGNTIVTGTATQKAALQLLVHTLSKQAQAIAAGAGGISSSASLIRQSDQILDMMKVALTEHKKIGYMTGTELATQRGVKIAPTRRAEIERGLREIDKNQNEFFKNLKTLAREGKWSTRRDLMELYELSGGKVRTLDHVHEYLKSLLRGGRMDGENIVGRWRTELRSVFYNSILSGPKTPIKAAVGTNLIGLLRPFQAYLGASLMRGPNAKTEMFIAAAQIDALGKAWAEGFQMFKHNWDLGVNRKNQDYMGRFDYERDIGQWKGMKKYYDNYGSTDQQRAYNWIDNIVDLNGNPWMRYSQNGMGAGDALARTIIGRFNMRAKAARAAIESGVDLDDVTAWAAKHEEEFRKQIFKQNAEGNWVISDEATRLAGDEAAMTKALQGNLEGIEKIARVTGMRAFFPFVRTGFNALRLSWSHTELFRKSAEFQDIMRGQNLDAYGIKPEDLGQAQALIKGRMAMGNTIIGMGTIAAATGLMTGDYPMDKESRDLWKLNKIQPYSFKFGNTYVSYKDIEPFNTLFALTANVVNNSHVLGEDLRDEWLEKAVFMTTAVIVDKSMLAGVEDLAGVLSADTAGGKLKYTGAKFLRAHLPYSGLMASLGSLMDANKKEANTFLEVVAQRDLGFKTLLQPKYDILSKDRSGKPLSMASDNPLMRLFNSLSPVAVTFSDGDFVKEGLQEMSFNLPEIVTQVNGVALNSMERSQLQKIMSQGNLRKRLEYAMRGNGVWRKELTAYKNQGLRQADGYDLKQQRFYRIISNIFMEEKAKALEILKSQNPELVSRILERKGKANLTKQGRYEYLIHAFPK